MLTLAQPRLVKVFAGVLWSDAEAFAAAEERMASMWGPCDLHSPNSPFTYTNYYDAEMGPGLQRSFLSFEQLADASSLAELKLQANDMELCSAIKGQRRVNIDVGYLDYHKVVLASTKEGPCKVYVGHGIWADMTLRYRRGAFEPFEWTFLDFKSGVHNAFFAEVRARYKGQLRTEAATSA